MTKELRYSELRKAAYEYAINEWKERPDLIREMMYAEKDFIEGANWMRIQLLTEEPINAEESEPEMDKIELDTINQITGRDLKYENDVISVRDARKILKECMTAASQTYEVLKDLIKESRLLQETKNIQSWNWEVAIERAEQALVLSAAMMYECTNKTSSNR